jgi:hypothetical protein
MAREPLCVMAYWPEVRESYVPKDFVTGNDCLQRPLIDAHPE